MSGNGTSPKAVWKFPIELTDHPVVKLPKGAQLLRFDVQDRVPTVWALVDPAAPPELRALRLAGTGHPIEESPLTYVGSCFQGPFVWHLFEVRA